MKKIISIVLSVVFVLSLSTTAFANLAQAPVEAAQQNIEIHEHEAESAKATPHKG